jgi:predicted ATP-dependent endonuclease of OLD family
MYLKQLILKNYRQFPDVDISFNEGINVLIGKNSSGKSSILEAIDFLLSNDHANISPYKIIPYNISKQDSVQVRVEGHFQMSKKEKELMCSVFNDEYYALIMDSDMEIIFIKYIIKKEKEIDVLSDMQINGNGISKYDNLMSFVRGSLMPWLQLDNVIKIDDNESSGIVQDLRPINELLQRASHHSSYLNQYLRAKFYETKQRDPEKYEKITNQIRKIYPDISDMDICMEFDPHSAQLQIYFNSSGSDIKMPLEDEGAGIREFFYLYLTLYYFTSDVILKDEALTHMHKSLLSDFILSIEGLQFQLIVTSHIKELIKTLDFGNVIICKKNDGVSTARNMMQIEEIDTVLNELGYPIEAVPEIENLIQETT